MTILKRNHKMGVISSPMGEGNIYPFFNLTEILGKIDSNTIFIAVHSINPQILKKEIGNYRIIQIIHKKGINIQSRILNYIITQIEISLKIIFFFREVNTWVFFIDNGLLIPIITSKICGKKVIIIIGGNLMQEVEQIVSVFEITPIFLSKINKILADKIIVYSSRLINLWKLERFGQKILIAHRHFLNFTTFTITTPYKERQNFIGYIGRLSWEKGVQHFAEALPSIFCERKDIRAFIYGDGQLKEQIEALLLEAKLNDLVYLPGWISHEELPHYLNQLRLLILPSYTEGLPNIMLEAMACGTPVLATPVGAIPDVIRDGETGFIMEDNSPECIARNVLQALSDPRLEGVSERGRRYVEGEYTFEKTVERWKENLRDADNFF